MKTSKEFSLKRFLIIGLVFVFLLILTHFMLRMIRYQTYFDMPQYWPLSIFMPKYLVWQDLPTLVGIIALSFWFIKIFLEKNINLLKLMFVGMLLMVMTNLLQGIKDGFVIPLGAELKFDEQYWQDAERVKSISNLIANYTTLQPDLHIHSRVHPPGALVLMTLLHRISGKNVYLVDLFILVIGSLTAFLLFSYLKNSLNPEVAWFGVSLFLVLPSIQIYSIASLDYVMTFCFFGVFWAFQKYELMKYKLITIIGLFISSMMTFGVIFLVPVLFLDEFIRTKKAKNILKLLLIELVILLGVYKTIGFNYWESFSIGHSFETPGGKLYMTTYPLSFWLTRLEDVAELFVFLGPWLSYMIFVQFKHWKNTSNVSRVGMLAFLVILGFFLGGAYFTGETARAAQYIYPFLILIIADYLYRNKLNYMQQTILISLTLGQSVLMQAFGSYRW